MLRKMYLKSGKDAFEVELSQEDSFEDFQGKVFAMTDIPPKNLKLLVKAKMIKDLESLLAIPAEVQIMVLGTKMGKELKHHSELEVEINKVEESVMPTRYGLVNIGNTCYMNAALQLLRSVPSFEKAVAKSTQLQKNNMLTRALEGVLRDLKKEDVQPKMFVGTFLHQNPQYQPLGEQHDSDQFLQQILSTLVASSPQVEKILNETFQLGFVDQLKNTDIEEPVITTVNNSLKLCCSLGGVEKHLKVGTLQEGIKLSLETTLEKTSAVDGNMHKYVKTTRFSSLPPYMLVQMIRFFWKKADDLPHSKPVATKICKSIDFGTRLDIYEFCSDELKQSLQPGRNALDKSRQEEDVEYKKAFDEFKKIFQDSNKPETRLKQEFKQEWKLRQKVLTEGLETGVYELCGAVTHLGHSIESGHYLAWIKENEQEWTKYDDNTVFQQPSEKIQQLRGGQPNLEIGYILLYRKVYAREA